MGDRRRCGRGNRAVSGRVASRAILKALGIRSGDQVVVPGHTCVVVPWAISFAGATSIYTDVEPATYNISLIHLEAAFQQVRAGRIRAVIVQHTYGVPADIDPITAWARDRGLAVIEDCAHAIGSRYRNSDGGWQDVARQGDAAFFSSQWSKPFTTGLGGWAIAKNPEVMKRIRRFRDAECVPPSAREVSRLAGELLVYHAFVRPRLYWPAMEGYRLLSRNRVTLGSSSECELAGVKPADYAKRMSAFQGWLGRRRIERIGPVIEHRRKLKGLYDEALALEGLPSFQIPDYADPVLLRYPIRVSDKPRVLAEARRLHIELGDWFNHPLHPRGANVDILGWRDGMCPNAERAAREVVNLPMHTRIGEREVERAVKFVKPCVIPTE